MAEFIEISEKGSNVKNETSQTIEKKIICDAIRNRTECFNSK